MAEAPDAETIASMTKIWKTIKPGIPFEYSWLKDALYARESAWGTVSILGFLAFIAITISCLGLLGMVMYAAETRRKEIAIRKVMGASITSMVLLLSRGFIKLILIAGAIALPLSYVAGFLFLNIFANRIAIGLDIFASGFLGLLVLALLTIGTRVYRSAAANPVNNLRVE
jgi:putative ABC transport system permease protein